MARSAERGRLSLFYAIDPKVFPLGGAKHKHKKLNRGKVARMRRKRGASLPKISINSMKQMKVFPLNGEKHKSKKLNWGKVARMRRKRGARRFEISDKVLDNQLIDLLLLFNPLLFQPVVCPSLSPFAVIKPITLCGRHLSHMQPFSLMPYSA